MRLIGLWNNFEEQNVAIINSEPRRLGTEHVRSMALMADAAVELTMMKSQWTSQPKQNNEDEQCMLRRWQLSSI